MKNRPILKLLTLAFCLVMLSACTLPPTPEPTPKPLHRPVPGPAPTAVPLPIGDGGLLSKDPCGPPCFLGVVPDVTTYTEAIQILTDYQYLDSCKERDNTEEGGVQWIGCSSTFIFDFDQDKSHVIFVGFDPQQEITVQDVIDEFGEPVYLNVIVSGYEYSIRVTTIRMYYPDSKMAIWLEDQKGGSYLLEPTTEIDNVRYLGGDLDDSIFRPRKQDWQGYIEYFEK